MFCFKHIYSFYGTISCTLILGCNLLTYSAAADFRYLNRISKDVFSQRLQQ